MKQLTYSNPYGSQTKKFHLSHTYHSKSLKTSPSQRHQFSAKNHAIRSLENKLSEKGKEIETLKAEIKLLHRLQVRQDRELNRIVKQEDEMPQILRRHEEEVKTLRTLLKKKDKEVAERSRKSTELLEEMQRLSELNKKLQSLVKNGKLQERDRLSAQVEEMRQLLQKKDQRTTVRREGQGGR